MTSIIRSKLPVKACEPTAVMPSALASNAWMATPFTTSTPCLRSSWPIRRPRLESTVGITVSACSTRTSSSPQKIGWVREGAGERFASIELSARILVVEVTDQPELPAADFGSKRGLSTADVLASPHLLLGSVEGIIEALLERRQRFGFSHYVWNDSATKTLAPVVSRLSGR